MLSRMLSCEVYKNRNYQINWTLNQAQNRKQQNCYHCCYKRKKVVIKIWDWFLTHPVTWWDYFMKNVGFQWIPKTFTCLWFTCKSEILISAAMFPFPGSCLHVLLVSRLYSDYHDQDHELTEIILQPAFPKVFRTLIKYFWFHLN